MFKELWKIRSLAMCPDTTVMCPVLSPLDRVVDRSAWHRKAMSCSVVDITLSVPDRAGC